MVKMGDLCDLQNGRAFKPTDWEKKKAGGLPIIRIQNLNNPQAEFNYYSGKVDDRLIVHRGDLLFSWSGSRGTSFGPHIWDHSEGILNQHIFNVRHNDTVNRKFFYWMLKKSVEQVEENLHGGVGLVHITKGNLERIEVPLPPLEEQERIVAELDGYQKVIEGAHQIIDNYKPTIKIDPKWPLEELETLCSNFQNGANFSKEQMGSGIRFVNIKDLFSESYVNWEQLGRVNLDEKEIERKLVNQDDLLFVRSSVKEEGVGFPSLMPACPEPIVFCGFIIKCSPIQERILPKYLLFLLRTPIYRQKVVALSNRANITNISQDSIKSLIVPIPPLDVQREIVAELETERALVESNRKLAEIFEKKIQTKLAEIWGEKTEIK